MMSNPLFYGTERNLDQLRPEEFLERKEEMMAKMNPDAEESVKIEWTTSGFRGQAETWWKRILPKSESSASLKAIWHEYPAFCLQFIQEYFPTRREEQERNRRPAKEEED
jgi:hypothetical protein